VRLQPETTKQKVMGQKRAMVDCSAFILQQLALDPELAYREQYPFHQWWVHGF